MCPLTVHGCAINNSRAAGNGGAIFARYSLTVDQSSFLTFNTAGGSGGAIYSKPDDTGAGVTITDSQLEYNTATAGSGGALYFNTGNGTGAGALNISGDTTLFASNQAGQRGGAVFQLGGTISATSSSSAGGFTGFQGDTDSGVSGSTESASELDLEQVQVVSIDINVSGGSDPNNWAIWLDTEPPPGSPSQINTSRVNGGDSVISRNF